MILKDSGTRPGGRRFSLEDQARALALVLRDEFGVAFAFYDAATGAPVSAREEVDEAALPGMLLTPTQVAEITADGRARVTPLSEDRYQLALLLHEAGRPVLVAAAEVVGLAQTIPEAVEERLRLQKWLQAVSDRLRMADQLLVRRRQEEPSGQVQSAWEVALTAAHLARGVRIHKDPFKNRQRILETAHGLLGAHALVWVPHQLDTPVLIQGETVLAPADCRQLAAALSQSPGMQPGQPIILNDFPKTSWGARFPSVFNLLAFLITDQGPVGWVIALNKKGTGGRGQGAGDRGTGPWSLSPDPCSRTGFRRSDAALLTPFVALLELHARGSRRYQDLKDLLVGLTRSLTAALDAKDSYTFGHSERVARIAVELGRELGLEGDELADVYLAGLLHDVGKIGIRDAVLSKVEPLTVEEFEHIKRHVTIGYSILSDLRQIRNLLPGVLYHHERWDGTGYPEGLAGEAIPLLARILAVADAYDAMSTTRPYRDAIPCRRVEEILVQGAGTQWDRRVVEAFLRCRQKIHTIRQRGVGESLQQAIDGALRIDNSLSQWKSDILPRRP